MTVTIKFSDNTQHKYNNFEDILNIYNYNDIIYMNCNGNSLTSLPKLPNILKRLKGKI